MIESSGMPLLGGIFARYVACLVAFQRACMFIDLAHIFARVGQSKLFLRCVHDVWMSLITNICTDCHVFGSLRGAAAAAAAATAAFLVVSSAAVACTGTG
jgi:hypothetical protein